MRRTGQKSHAKRWSSNSGLPGSSGLGVPLFFSVSHHNWNQQGEDLRRTGSQWLLGQRLEGAKRRGQPAGLLGRTQKAAPTLLSRQVSPGLCLEGCLWEGCYRLESQQEGTSGCFPHNFPLALPFCIHISLHSLQKRQVSRADGLGLGGQASIPIPFLPPWTCSLSKLQFPHLDKGHNTLWR